MCLLKSFSFYDFLLKICISLDPDFCVPTLSTEIPSFSPRVLGGGGAAVAASGLGW